MRSINIGTQTSSASLQVDITRSKAPGQFCEAEVDDEKFSVLFHRWVPSYLHFRIPCFYWLTDRSRTYSDNVFTGASKILIDILYLGNLYFWMVRNLIYNLDHYFLMSIDWNPINHSRTKTHRYTASFVRKKRDRNSVESVVLRNRK